MGSGLVSRVSSRITWLHLQLGGAALLRASEVATASETENIS